MITKVLILVFFVYVLQSTLAYMQIKRSYNVINDVKAQHKGSGCRMVTGTGRTRFLLIARGYFIILIVNDDDIVVDYYGMDGYTVFASPKRKEQYIGRSLDELEAGFKKKNEKKAFAAAREQLQLLREQSIADANASA